jgi:geranylgeranyl pyrophosphate synthase
LSNSTLTRNTAVDNSIDILFSFKNAIDKELNRFFNQDLKQFIDVEISPFGQEAFCVLREFNLRPAKRLRGALTAITCDIAAGKNKCSTGIKAASAIELIQDYLLVVDDVMDLSEFRRGGPTTHRFYKKEGFDDHTAKMLAINIGLLAQHLANLIMCRINAKDELVLKAIEIMHKNIELTGLGQMDDLNQSACGQVTIWIF